MPSPPLICRDRLVPALGEPLDRPPLEMVEGAWTLDGLSPDERREKVEEYLAPDWECYAVRDWLVLVWTETWGRELTAGVVALRSSQWTEGAQAFGGGWPGQRAWAEVPPVVAHPLWGVDRELRHQGGPWKRSTLRSGEFPIPDAAQDALLSWVEEVVQDLDDESRWLDGEHQESEFLDGYDNGRVPDLDLWIVPRRSGEPPAFRDVTLMDARWREPRRKGAFGPLIRKIKPVWDDGSGWYVQESAAGDALMLVVAADDVSATELDLLVDMVQRAEDFWVYDAKALRLFGAEDIRSWWHDSQASASPDGAHESEAVESAELQLLVATRAEVQRLSFAMAIERMDEETGRFRPDGPFGHLLAEVPPTWHVEESTAGDALLLTVNSLDLTAADIDRLEKVLRQAKTGFRVFETMTMDVFDVDELHQWWDEARGVD